MTSISSPIIYGLIDPRDDQLRYVGKTTMRLSKRLGGHFKDAKKYSRTHLHHWLNTLSALGLRPTVFEIEKSTKETWAEAEQFYISYFKSIGVRLVNLAPGGEGATGPKSLEHRKKLSKANMGNTPGNKGIPHSKETRDKISLACKGKNTGPLSEEHRAKLSAARRKVLSEGRGKTFVSDERKAELAIRCRTLLREKNLGRPWTSEQRQKIKNALQARYDAGWSPRGGWPK